MSTTVVEFENQDVIVVEMSGRGPIGPRGRQGEPGPAGPSEWGVIQGNISDQTDLQNALDAKADIGASYTKSEEDALLAQKADADSVYTKTETDSLLADKADTDDVYSKTEVNTLLSGKADADAVYTKTETDTLLGAKADVGDSYTKAEEDALLAVKANSADVYTKAQTDTLLADKADADTVYTKTETDSLLSNKADSDSVYTKTEVDDALADKADSADVYTKTETDALLLDKAPVILSSASGPIASFTDGSASPVTALSVAIEPVQDLHGYDNPWPAGGGKNLLPPFGSEYWCIGNTTSWYPVKTQDTSPTFPFTYATTGDAAHKNVPVIVIPCKPNTTYTITAPTDLHPAVAEYADIDDVTSTSNVLDNWGSYTNRVISKTTTNNTNYLVIGFTNWGGASDVTVTTSTEFQLELGSTATSWAPYSNICPISGWDEAVVTRTGKNIFVSEIRSDTIKGVTCVTNSDGSIDISGTPNASGAGYYKLYGKNTTDVSQLSPIYANLQAGTKIYAKLEGSDTSDCTLLFQWNRADGSVTSSQATYSGDVFTIPSNAVYVYIAVRLLNLSTSTPVNYHVTPFIAVSDAAVPYEPPQCQQVTIDLDGTRYGAMYDALTGKMVVDRAEKTITSASDISRNSAKQYYIQPTKMPGIRQPSAIEATVISDKFKPSMSISADGIVFLNAGGATRFNTVKEYASASDLIADLGSIQFVYPLATPLTVQLSPSQMSTLLGQNNIFADTGDVAVEYRADTKLYIEKLTKPTEDDMTANTNIAANTFFMVGNSLYYATSAIATGTTIVPGSNCTALSLAEALNNLNA